MIFFLILYSSFLFSIDIDIGFLLEEFWCYFEPPEHIGSDFGSDKEPLTEEEIVLKIFDEASFIISGMIYGFNFTYAPKDSKRGIDEIFHLTPAYRILRGDPSLSVQNTRTDGQRLFAQIMYNLEDHQKIRLKSWDSNITPFSTGYGRETLMSGENAKLLSISNGIKEAIRNYLRERIFNKPKAISGEVLLVENPYTIIDSGAYLSKVKIKLKIDELIPHKIY